MPLRKDARERLIFESFAQVAGLYTDGATIESRSPPEPDILLRTASGNALAFELVEILDQEFSQSIQRGFKTKELCEAYLASMPGISRQLFMEKYRNADIFVSFRPPTTTRRRKNSLPVVFERLLALPDGLEGDVLWDIPGLTTVLEHATISRGRFVGPMFDTSETLWVGDPTVAAIESKLDKTYESPHELSLLAYIETNPMFPDDVWLGNLAEYESELSDACQFSHIFVFDWQSKTIKYTWQRNS